MSYFVNKSDGTAIIVLDGTKDTTSTSLTLFGRLTQSYGELQNENFVHLLENFAYSNAPAYATRGQLWYDTNVDNIKAYTGSNWVTVGSDIVGNVQLSGNLFIGPNAFQIQDLGDVSITNKINGGDISFYGNIGGVKTRTLYINGATGLLEVDANASANYGVTTKIYVDSEIQRATANSDANLLANVAIINANLAVRVSEEDQLRANITAANAQIALRDTITRVNSINSAIDTAMAANVAIINANLAARVNQTVAVEAAMLANVSTINTETNSLRANIIAANVEIDSLRANITASNVEIALRAPIANPVFTGIPRADTAILGTNSDQLATTEFVINTVTAIPAPNIAGALWQGSHKFVSTLDPSNGTGVDGDIWFKYS